MPFWYSLCLTALLHSIHGAPLKFPDQPQQSQVSQNAQIPQGRSLGSSEGRSLSIQSVPNGFFNRLINTNSLLDDVIDGDQSRHGHRRRRPCKGGYYRSNNPSEGEGRFLFNIQLNDYNYYDSNGHETRPQYDTYGGYPCQSLGGHHRPERPHRPHRPHRPNRPLYPGTGALSDDVGGSTGGGGGGGLGFFGPGGLFDVNQFLQNWLNPQSGGSSGVLGDSAGGGSTPRPLLEFNVQDAFTNVV